MLPFLIIIILVIGLYMAWNIGANDLANAMGDVVGSKALELRQVIILAGIMEFLGAVFFGSRVTSTVAKGIVPIGMIDPHLVTIGALSAMLAAGIWITVATYFNLPVSTSHAIVGAMLGFGIGAAVTGAINITAINMGVMVRIVASWILSPVAGGVMAFIVFMLIRKLILARADDSHRVERVFRYFVIASSCYIAFAHGSNDVANAIAPVSAALGLMGSELPIWILALGGGGIVFGLATWGYRVIETVGKKITELTPTRGFSADVSTATIVIVCSSFGMPVSTTHTLVGAIIGVGLAGGLSAVNLGVIKKIVASWVMTVPVAMVLTTAIYLSLLGVGV